MFREPMSGLLLTVGRELEANADRQQRLIFGRKLPNLLYLGDV